MPRNIPTDYDSSYPADRRCPACHGTGAIFVWDRRDEYGRFVQEPSDVGTWDDPDWIEGCDCTETRPPVPVGDGGMEGR